MIRRGRPGAAATLAILVLAAALLLPAPCAARATFTIQIYWGGVAAGGYGLLIYLSSSWDVGLLPREIKPALLNLDGDGVRWGLPVPAVDGARTRPDGGTAENQWELPLVRLEF